MGDLMGALMLAEEVTPQLNASGSARLHGDALMVQAEVLFALMQTQNDGACMQLLQEAGKVLERAIEQYEAVAELNHLRRCHYLLARLCHQVGDIARRDQHSRRFRLLSQFLSDQDSSTSWQDLGIACLQKEPQDASIERASRWPETTNASGAGPPSNSCVPNPEQSFMDDSRSNIGQHADSVPSSMPKFPVPAGEDDTSVRRGNQAKCPALDQLLLLAEGDSTAPLPFANSSAACGATNQGADASSSIPMAITSMSKASVSGNGCGTSVVIGEVRTLYPLAAILGN
jgi:hypothetical protein